MKFRKQEPLGLNQTAVDSNFNLKILSPGQSQSMALLCST